MPEARVRFLDLPAQYGALRDEIRAAVDRVFATQSFVLGPVVAHFEEALARYLGVPHAIGVASGTDALYLALAAAGIGAGDAVVTSPFSFVASATAIARAGARPYFVDIDAASFNLDPAATAHWIERRCRREGTRLRALGGEVLRAIVPVHLYGRPCDLPAFERLTAEHGLDLIEDAAQAIGARADDGRAVGAVGRLACFSFYPTKNLGGAGDGGAVTCSSDADAAAVRSLSRQGTQDEPYRHHALGLASRLDAVQAAVLEVKLAHLERWNATRREHAARYDRLFRERLAARSPIILPEIGRGHVVHQYVVRVPDRDAVRAALAAEEIETQVYYPIPLHLQPCFAGLGYRAGDFPEAERASREVLALPLYPELSAVDAERVVTALARALERVGR